MAYKQPRVPQLRDGVSLYDYAKELMMFLRDFCMASWRADKRRDEQMEEIDGRLRALEGKEE